LNTIVERTKEHLIAFVAIAFVSILARRLKRLTPQAINGRPSAYDGCKQPLSNGPVGRFAIVGAVGDDCDDRVGDPVEQRPDQGGIALFMARQDFIGLRPRGVPRMFINLSHVPRSRPLVRHV